MDSVKEGLATEHYYASLQTFKTLLARKVSGPRKDQRAALDMIEVAFGCCCNASCAADIASSLFHVLEVFHVPLSDNLLALMLKFASGISSLPEGLAPSTNFLQDAAKYIQNVGYGDCSVQDVDKIVQALSERIFSRWLAALPPGQSSSNERGTDDLVEALSLSARAPDAALVAKQLSAVVAHILPQEAAQILFSYFLRVVATVTANERFRGVAFRGVVKAVNQAWLPSASSVEKRFVHAFGLVLALGRDERKAVAQSFVGAFRALLNRYGHGAETALVRVLSL
jgi:hypothetical protein